MNANLLFRRGLFALTAALSILYLIAYYETDGNRSPLVVVGLFSIASIISKLPQWLESLLSQSSPRYSNSSVLLKIKTTAWGPHGLKSEEVMKASDSYKNEHVNIAISFNPRTVDRVEISPIRRSLDEVEGLVRDAERLANET
jgi:hypothetical protein